MKHINEFMTMKSAAEPITMVTCYDYTSACILEKTNIDCVLVGDSVGMVMHGHADPTKTTLDMLVMHTAAVARGIKSKCIIADLPFLSYRKSLAQTMDAVHMLIQAGAHAVKLEGINGNETTIQHIVGSGVPVMGHIGLTPQHIHALGGFKMQGATEQAQATLIAQANALETAGCFATVLECIPTTLAQKITTNLSIPTIGIGAGPHTSGQVLVLQDLLGLQTSFAPKFLKTFLNGETLFQHSIEQYVKEVKSQCYPSVEHCYEN